MMDPKCANSFEICSAICSCGGIDKSELGIPPEYKIKLIRQKTIY